MQIIVDDEFKNILPPLTKDEYQELEGSILDEGCREPIVLWNGMIIDGFNRYEICKKHRIDFKTSSKMFDNRESVKVWIVKNQLGRRNLPAYERTRLALMLKPEIEEKAKDKQKKEGKALGGDPTLSQNSAKPSIDTREEIAKTAHVSHDTVDKVEVIEMEGSEEIKEQARKGNISINKAYQQIKKRSQGEREEAFTVVKSKIEELSGEKKDPNNLVLLKRYWRQASNTERREFFNYLRQNKQLKTAWLLHSFSE